jgi:hypothetical protein
MIFACSQRAAIHNAQRSFRKKMQLPTKGDKFWWQRMEESKKK